jgi:hypothetical protein
MPIISLEKVIQIPPLVRRNKALLLNAATPLSSAELSQNAVNRIGMGATFVPHGCEPIRRGNVDCDTDWLLGEGAPVVSEGSGAVTGVEEGKTDAINPYPDVEVQRPFKLVDALKCSSFSMDLAEMDARLLNRMAVQTSKMLTEELITGWASSGMSFNDSATTLTPPSFPASSSVVDSVAYALEQHLADTLHGAEGIVFVPPAFLASCIEAGWVHFLDNEFMTATGHRVVADSGHSGLIGPAAVDPGEFWFFASGPVQYHVTDPMLLGDTLDQMFDREINLLERISEAMGIVVFDPCTVGAVKLDLNAVNGS